MMPKRKKTPELIRRQRALAFVVGKYKGRACDFRTADCVRMARTLLVKMGHRKLPKLPRYSSLVGAKRALAQRGWKGTAEMLDAVLPGRRIAPSTMWPGDLAVVPDDQGLGAIWIRVDNGRMLGWHQDAEEAVIIAPHRIDMAWRV
jgi:hypothetical protein